MGDKVIKNYYSCHLGYILLTVLTNIGGRVHSAKGLSCGSTHALWLIIGSEKISLEVKNKMNLLFDHNNCFVFVLIMNR